MPNPRSQNHNNFCDLGLRSCNVGANGQTGRTVSPQHHLKLKELYQTINNLQAASQMLIFLQENKIMDLDGLHKFVISMHSKQSAIRDDLKPIERRLKTLDEHIKQAEYYREFTKINRLYKQQKPKDKDKFYESHRRELTLYEAAERYFKGVLNGREKIPLPTWKAEHEKLTAERKRLNAEYLSLKDEVIKVEKISRSVQDIMHEERRREQPVHKRSQKMEW